MMKKLSHTIILFHVQWNPSKVDTMGKRSVLYWPRTQMNGRSHQCLYSEVSSFEIHNTRKSNLGWEKVPCLERCPQFRGPHTVQWPPSNHTYLITLRLFDASSIACRGMQVVGVPYSFTLDPSPLLPTYLLYIMVSTFPSNSTAEVSVRDK